MTTYILLIAIMTSTNAISQSSTEFNSKGACELAAQNIVENVKYKLPGSFWVSATCNMKG